MKSVADGMESLGIERMESSRSDAWNPQLVAVWNLALASIKSSRRKCTFSDAMPDEVGIPYTLTRDAMPSLRLV